MENASKALIIAGAILLSILIIGLGMAVYNSSNDTTKKANLSATEVRAFNSQFSDYEGSQTGSNIRDLYSAVMASNKDSEDNNKGQEVSLTLPGGEEGKSGSISDIKTSKRYTVKLNYDEDTGLINEITVE